MSGVRVAWSIAAALAATTLVKTAIAALVAGREHRALREHPDPSAPTVTVLQPIRSGDPDLADALEHTALELPGARILHLVDDDDAEAQRVSAALAARHAGIETLLCAPAPHGVSPKSRKLGAAAERLTGPLLLLDDDTRILARTADALVAALGRAELSTALPVYRSARTLAGRAVAAWVNHQAPLLYLPLAPLGPRSANGMAVAVDADVLRAAGGFRAIERSIVDDLALARRIVLHGGRVVQLASPVVVATDVAGLGALVRLMHRWMLFASLALAAETPVWRAALVAGWGVPPALTGVVAAIALARPAALPALGLVAVARTASAWIARRAIDPDRELRRLGAAPLDPLLGLATELAQPLHLLHALVDRTVAWRGRRWRVRGIDRFEEA